MALLSFEGSPHGGAHKLLPEWDQQAFMTATTIVDHSIVGSALGAYFFFRDRTGIESHFIISKTGMIWQLMDTGRRADANLNANAFAISIETEDNGDPDSDPWTTEQLESLHWLHNKLRAVHPTIPRKRISSCFGGGLGYHSMCPTTSSNPWTSSAGKTCPGKPVRINQFETILVPAFMTDHLVLPGGDELSAAEVKEIKDYVDARMDKSDGLIVRRVLWSLVHDISDRTWVVSDPGYGNTAELLKTCNLLQLRALLLGLPVAVEAVDEDLTDEQADAMAAKLLGALPDKVVDRFVERATT